MVTREHLEENRNERLYVIRTQSSVYSHYTRRNFYGIIWSSGYGYVFRQGSSINSTGKDVVSVPKQCRIYPQDGAKITEIKFNLK